MKQLILFLSFLVLTVSARSQNEGPESLTLDQAVEMGLKYNNTLKNSAIDVKIAEQRVREIMSVGLPQINAAGSLNDYIKSPISLIPGEFFGRPGKTIEVSFVPKFNASASVSASQLLFNGSYFLGVQASKQYAELVKAQMEKSKTDVERDVTKAYLTVLSTMQTKEILTESKKRIDKTLSDLIEINKQGLNEKLDVDRLRLSQSTIIQQTEQLEATIKVLMSLLNLQMGYDVNKPIQLTSTLDELNKKFAVNVYEKTQFDVNNKMEYKLISKGIELQRMNVKANKMAYYPTLAGFGTFQYTGQNKTLDFPKYYQTVIVGLQLNVPVFDGFSKDSKIKQAKYSLSQYENNRAMIQNALAMAYINAQTGLQNAQRQFELSKQSLALAETIYNTTALKYKEGVGSSFELTTAESDLQNAKIQNILAQYNLINAVFELKTALGK